MRTVLKTTSMPRVNVDEPGAPYVTGPAKLLIVAEQLNQKLRTMAVLDSSCGRFLRPCLDVRWTAIEVNALGKGAPSDHVLRSLSRGRIVLALGRRSCFRLCRLGVVHHPLPHPQWARRFGGSKEVSTRWYRVLLKQAVAHALRHP